MIGEDKDNEELEKLIKQTTQVDNSALEELMSEEWLHIANFESNS